MCNECGSGRLKQLLQSMATRGWHDNVEQSVISKKVHHQLPNKRQTFYKQNTTNYFPGIFLKCLLPRGFLDHCNFWFFPNFMGHLACDLLRFGKETRRLAAFRRDLWDPMDLGFDYTALREHTQNISKYLPWEPTTFIFRGYNPYF